MDEQIKANIKNKNSWMRLLYMLIFVALYSVAELVIAVVVIFQILSNLITRQSNIQLLGFGKQLSRYVYQVLLYLTYNSEDRPFPFSAWPSSDEEPSPKNTNYTL